VSIRLRSEMPGDEDAIDLVNCSAFRQMGEADLVRMTRSYYLGFDRRYSITAWDGDEMVGHVLFSPARIRLMGETVSALVLAPIAVVPKRQRSGIGGELIRRGHELGKREGFALAFLCGHPSYYPRHGYRACFGFAKVTIEKDKLPEPGQEFRIMPVRPADIPWLVERQAAELADVDFGWLWGTGLSEWRIPCVNSVMWWTKDGRRAAYTAAPVGKGKCSKLLADDPALARDVIATIKPESVDHHPSGWLARNVLEKEWSKAEVKVSEAAMACELREGVLEPYLKAVESGERPVGSCNFTLPVMAL